MGQESLTAARLQDQTFPPTLRTLLLLGEKSRPGCMFEHFTDAFVGLCRALEVFVGADLLADFLALFDECAS